MRKQTYTMIAAVVLLGCLAVSAKAQCGGMLLIAKIPFQFSTLGATLPAGEYHIRCFGNERLLQIRSRDGRAHAFVPMIPVSGRSQEGARLVFHRYGSRYFFVQAWVGGNPGAGRDTGLELPKTHAEDSAAREAAGSNPKRETIALTALR
jgi:hypothetical protein